jgi:hypothetical protein
MGKVQMSSYHRIFANWGRKVTKAQKVILAVYSVAVILIIVYPPFYLDLQGAIIQSAYSWLWQPITLSTSGKPLFGQIGSVRLLAELFGATAVAWALVLLCKPRN